MISWALLHNSSLDIIFPAYFLDDPNLFPDLYFSY